MSPERGLAGPFHPGGPSGVLSSRFRLVGALLTAVLAAALLTGLPTTPARAGVVTSCSNTACPDPTGWKAERWDAHAGYPSFGGTVDGMNCTNYVAWRLIKTGGFTATQVRGLGNAAAWDTAAASRGYTVNRTPAVGAVAQWDANHVAYVEQVNTDGTIVISESNVWAGTSSNRMWLRFRVVTASAVDHFIHLRPPGVKSFLAPGDFDGDGHPDLLAVRNDSALMLYRGDGAGGFVDPAGTKIASGWAAFYKVFAAGDFSGDGFADVFTITKAGQLYLYRGDGAGAFLSGRTLLGSGWDDFRVAFSPGDFSGDGFPDVIAVRTDGRLRLYTGNGAGGWTGKSKLFAAGFGGVTRIGSPGDFDGDGLADMIAVWPDGAVKLYPGDGNRGFLNTSGIVIGAGWTGITGFAGRGDVTGDGKTDLFLLRKGGILTLHAGDGATFDADGIPLSVTW